MQYKWSDKPELNSVLLLVKKNYYGKNFASLAFTDAVKEMQEKMGSRRVMRMERETYIDGLTENEMDFIKRTA